MQPEGFMPISLDLRKKPCLVLGGDDAAFAKAQALLAAGAAVRLVAGKQSAPLRALADQARLDLWSPTDLDGAADGVILAIDSGEDAGLSAALRTVCEAKGILLNSVDQPDHCDFHIPAIVRRGPVQVAISTGGAAPTLARNLRQLFERLLPTGLEQLVRQAASLRPHLKKRLSPDRQKTFWNKLFALETLSRSIGKTDAESRILMANLLKECATAEPQQGTVTLVGAGAGRADLITLRGLRAVETADVILHDALIDNTLLAHARRDAQLVAVGKRCGRHSSPQEFINKTLVNFARQGRRVVRLKCGDPFVFGRGGEELAFLASQGIDADVVPGVTAASVAAAATGIPLTHRGVTRRLTLMTAATNPSLSGDTPHWRSLLDGGTVALYMARRRLKTLPDELITAGVSPCLPVCIISNADFPDQQTYLSTLSAIADRLHAVEDTNPLLVILGDAAAAGALGSGDTEPLPVASTG